MPSTGIGVARVTLWQDGIVAVNPGKLGRILRDDSNAYRITG